MKVIRNKYVPFGRHYAAINLFGVVFAKCRLSRQELNHEYIHTLQQRELLFVGFYIIYIIPYYPIGQYKYIFLSLRKSHQGKQTNSVKYLNGWNTFWDEREPDDSVCLSRLRAS